MPSTELQARNPSNETVYIHTATGVIHALTELELRLLLDFVKSHATPDMPDGVRVAYNRLDNFLRGL